MIVSPAELSSRFGYPSGLTRILDGIVESIERLIPGRKSLVLSGSIATGDFVWRETADGVRFLSDIDATLYVSDSAVRDSAGRRDLDEVLSRLEEQISSALFHIDLSVQSFGSLSRIENRFQHVEARLAAVVMLGDDVFEEYPESVDARAARQSTLANLWKCVLNAPISDSSSDDEAYRMALSRTILDLPILVLSEEGKCLAGHRERSEAFLSRPDAVPLVDDDTRAAVRLGLRMRKDGSATRVELEKAALVSVRAAMRCFGVPAEQVFSASPEVVRRIEEIVSSRSFRRFLGESRGLLRGDDGIVSALRWWVRRKEPIGAAALLALFSFIIGGADGEPPSAISDRLSEFSGGTHIRGSGVEFVAAARRDYWRGRCRLNPSDAAKDQFYSRLLGEEADPLAKRMDRVA